MNYQVHTDLDTISQAWTLLDEIGLAGLLLKKEIKLDPQELCGQLFVQRKLIKYLALITHQDEVSMSMLDLPAAVEVITAFFTNITRTLAEFGGIGLEALMSPKNPEIRD